eukprot:5245636-Alexandrium_andersonii.AAC.1
MTAWRTSSAVSRSKSIASWLSCGRAAKNAAATGDGARRRLARSLRYTKVAMEAQSSLALRHDRRRT